MSVVEEGVILYSVGQDLTDELGELALDGGHPSDVAKEQNGMEGFWIDFRALDGFSRKIDAIVL